MACDPLTQSPDTIHILNGQRGKIANSLGFFFFFLRNICKDDTRSYFLETLSKKVVSFLCFILGQ